MEAVTTRPPLGTAIEDGTDSGYVRERHDRLVSETKTKRSQIEVFRRELQQPAVLPSPDDIVGRVFDLEARIASDPRAAREVLRRLATKARTNGNRPVVETPWKQGLFASPRETMRQDATKPNRLPTMGHLGI